LNERTRERVLVAIEKALKVGSSVAEILVQSRGSPLPVAVAAVAMRAVNTYQDLTALNPYSMFDGWAYLSEQRAFASVILEICKARDCFVPIRVNPGWNTTPRIAVISGVRFGFREHDGWSEGPWIEPGADSAAAVQLIHDLLWSAFGPSITLSLTLLGTLAFGADPLTDCLPSETARTLHAACAKFIAAGHSRAVLLYGAPGTGKSHIMRHVAKLAGGRSVRIGPKQLEALGASGMIGVLRTLRPSVVVMDDIDRLKEPDAILSGVEQLRTTIDLLLVSANNTAKMDAALLRPGRFDRLVEVTALDGAVLDRLVGADVPITVAARLRGLPVAYIDEFRRAREVLGLELALAEVEELVQRAANVSASATPATDGKPGSPAGVKG
jgi:hypothetical protein